MSDQKIETEITASTAQFNESMKGAAEGAKQAAEQIKHAFDSLAEIAGLSLGIEGLKKFIESMAELGLQTERTMAQLGMSAKEVTELGGLAKLTGTSTDGLATSLERMALNIQKSTRDAFNPAAQGLAVLGLKAKDLIGIPTSEYIEKLRDAVSKLNPSLNLTTALMAVGGRGVAQMVPFLQQSEEKWQEMKRAIDQASKGLAESVPTMAHTSDGLSLMGLSAQSLGAAIFTKLAPAIDTITTLMTGFIQSVRDSIQTGGTWDYVLSGVSWTIKAIAESIAALVMALRSMRVEAKAFWDLFGDTSDTYGAKLREDLAKIKKDFEDTVHAIWNPPAHVTVTKPPPRGDAGSIDGSAKDAMAAEQARLQGLINLEDNYYEQKKEKLDADFKLGSILESQKTDQLLAALEQRKTAQLGYYDDELKLAGLTKAEQQKLENEKTQVVQRATLDRQKIVDKSNEDQMKHWTSAAGDIASAWSSQLRGLLAGTTSWAQAMKNIMADLIVKWIGDISKFALEWAAKRLFMTLMGRTQDAADVGSHVATETGKTAATAAGVAARTSAQEAGFAEQMFMAIASALREIAVDAEKTFAGIFAFLSPMMGPAAAGPAAAGAGVVMAAGASVASFDIGAYSLPSDMLAMVHRREMVIPAGPADAFRQMLSGGGANGGGSGGDQGGGDMHLHVHALDAAGVRDLFMKHGSSLVESLHRQMRQGNRTISKSFK